MKVFELAKELGIDNKQLLSKLSDLNIEANSHLNLLSEEQVTKVKESMENKNTEEDEIVRLKKQIAEMESKLVEQSSSEELGFVEEEDFIPEISMNKAIKVMSLFTGGLNLKTSNDGTAQVFRFEKVGQIFPIVYSDLVKVIANQRKFFEQGYCMILDKDVIKAHYLEDNYKKFVDGRVINNILNYDSAKIKEIFANTTPVIQQSIVDTVIIKINSDNMIDKNKVTVMSEVYGKDIFELANKQK